MYNREELIYQQSKTVASFSYILKKLLSHQQLPISFPFSNPPITFSCPRIQVFYLPTHFQVCEAESLASFPLSHCLPHLKIQTRKLCLKDFTCGNHNAWLPFSCVCVNSLINIAGKDCLLDCYCVSLLEEGEVHIDFLLSSGSSFLHFLYFKELCTCPGSSSQKGGLSPVVQKIVS